MWKKDEVPTPTVDVQREGIPRLDRAAPIPMPTQAAVSGERAAIGRSIAIKGDVTGDEDLVIHGRVVGSVDLRQHSVTIGPEGIVKASVIGRIVTVEGRIEGNIQADEQVILRSSAHVQGDISAPRVVLEDGARFRGGVDMGEAPEPAERVNSAALSESRKVAERGRPTLESSAAASDASLSSAAKASSTNVAEVAAEARH